MKSFIFALLTLLSIAVFVCFNAAQTVSHIDEMLALSETLPKNKADFNKQTKETALAVQELSALWERWFPLISFTAGYENTNRCDEAIGALAIHFENGSGEDFAVSLSEFCDSLARLRILEGVHWHGIF